MAFPRKLDLKSLSIAFILYIASFLLFNFLTNISYGNYFLPFFLPPILAFSPFFLFAIGNQEIAKKLFLLKKISPSSLMWLLLLVVALIFPLQVMTTAFNSLFTNFDRDFISLAKNMKYVVLHNGLLGSIFLFAIVPAILEEVVFRGFLLGLIRKSGLGNVISVIIVALLFSLFHLSYLSYLPAFISGLIIGYLVVVMRSIYAGIFYHFLNNVIVVSSIFYGTQKMELNFNFIKEHLSWALPLFVFLITVGLWILFVKTARNQKKGLKTN